MNYILEMKELKPPLEACFRLRRSHNNAAELIRARTGLRAPWLSLQPAAFLQIQMQIQICICIYIFKKTITIAAN